MRFIAIASLAMLMIASVVAPAASARPCEGPGQAHIEDHGDAIAFWWDNPDWINDCREDVRQAAADADDTARDAAFGAVDTALGIAGFAVDTVRDARDSCDPTVTRGVPTIRDYGDYITIDGHFVWVSGQCGPLELGFGV